MGKCPSNENVLAAVALHNKWEQQIRAIYIDCKEKNELGLQDHLEKGVSSIRELLSDNSLRRYRFRTRSTAVRLLEDVCQKADEDLSPKLSSERAPVFLEKFLILCLAK